MVELKIRLLASVNRTLFQQFAHRKITKFAPQITMAPPSKKPKREKPKNEMVTGESPDGSERFTLFYGNVPLSNFCPSPFTLNDVQFQNTEQYFHYKKAEHFGCESSMQKILEAKTPLEQKRLGRKVSNYDNEEWQRVCVKYMKEGIHAKFSQNADLREQLLATAGTTIVEASPRDRKWGIGLGLDKADAFDRKCWLGRNLLGEVLTQVREELRAAEFGSDDGLVIGESPDGREKFTLFYGWTPVFSNYYKHTFPFEVEGVQFNCTEQYYHYMKAVHFRDENAKSAILAAESPDEQKYLSKSIVGFDKDEWLTVAQTHMKTGNIAKYSQNRELRLRLFETIGTTLAEASPRDLIWGIGFHVKDPMAFDRRLWRGQNWLGIVLVQVRDELMKLPDFITEAEAFIEKK